MQRRPVRRTIGFIHSGTYVGLIEPFGRHFVSGEVAPVRIGSTVLFPRGAVHLLHNTSDEEMKVICCFVPPTSLANHELHEDVDFPDADDPKQDVGSKLHSSVVLRTSYC